ncbi:MAG: arsenic efflux protein [Deltaproteobacteria bacterium]|nr:arsenic efflux protein [Deltaproteobacteria bacterium]
MHAVWDILQNTVVITAFVSMMMLVIEYLNVVTKGHAVDRLLNRRSKGYVAGVLLGLTPGCLGAFVMVSLYAHRRVSIGAIVATMIATSGDEAFVMLGLVPETAIIMFAMMGLLGLIGGWATDRFVLKKHDSNRQLNCAFETHPHKEHETFAWQRVVADWRHPSPVRAILSVTIALCIALMMAFKLGLFVPASEYESAHSRSHPEVEQNDASPEHDAHGDHRDDSNHSSHGEDENGHAHMEHGSRDSHAAHSEAGEDAHGLRAHESTDGALTEHKHNHGTGGWTWYMLMSLLLFGLFVVVTVSEHFLEDHLWGHVLKVHVPRMFLWTLGALTFIVVLEHYVNVAHLVQEKVWIVLGLAVLIGLIPESGPHLIFISLFVKDAIPLSILMASSIVQDGHGMVPLLAHSRRDFLLVKLINALVGALVGAAMLAAGW